MAYQTSSTGKSFWHLWQIHCFLYSQLQSVSKAAEMLPLQHFNCKHNIPCVVCGCRYQFAYWQTSPPKAFFQLSSKIHSRVLYWQLSHVQKVTAESPGLINVVHCVGNIAVICSWSPAIGCYCKELHSFSHCILDLLLLPIIHLWHVVLCDGLSIRQDIPWLKSMQHVAKAFIVDSAEGHHVFAMQ